jgi:hypothetical protein
MREFLYSMTFPGSKNKNFVTTEIDNVNTTQQNTHTHTLSKIDIVVHTFCYGCIFRNEISSCSTN